MSNLLNDLIATKALIDHPDKWRKGDRPAAPICAGEAMSEMIAIHASNEMDDRKVSMIWALGFSNLDELVAYNDAPTTTHSDMMQIFEAAIKKALEEATEMEE